VRLGTERAWVVHGAGGLDELSLEGESMVAEVVGGSVRLHTVTAAEAGLAAAPLATLRVASVAAAAERLRAVLAGERGPARDVVCLNAAAALVVAGRAADVRAGTALAAAAIDQGRASALLERLIAFTTAHAERSDPRER
jgi:anthranilate phosphoribosyltransferase